MTTAPGSTATPFGDPALGSSAPAATVITEPSIVDTILDLDKFLAGDVRLAERMARFCTEPDREARIDELEAELATLVDPLTGKPYETDEALDSGRTAYVVAAEIRDERFAMAEAMRSVRMRQLDDTAWQAFKETHKKAFATNEQIPERKVMLDDLLIRTAAAPTISAEQLKKLRTKVGSPQIDEMIGVAWQVNTESGVSVPKSPRSSHVLRQQGQSPS